MERVVHRIPRSRADWTDRHMQAMVPRSFGFRNHLQRTVLWSAGSILPVGLRGWIESRFYRHRDSMTMAIAAREWLVDYYREDVRSLGSLLNRDLSVWLSLPPASS